MVKFANWSSTNRGFEHLRRTEDFFFAVDWRVIDRGAKQRLGMGDIRHNSWVLPDHIHL